MNTNPFFINLSATIDYVYTDHYQTIIIQKKSNNFTVCFQNVGHVHEDKDEFVFQEFKNRHLCTTVHSHCGTRREYCFRAHPRFEDDFGTPILSHAPIRRCHMASSQVISGATPKDFLDDQFNGSEIRDSNNN